MPLRPFFYAFNGGEVAPEFDGRADHQRYFTSLRTCLNGITRPLGGVRRAPGTRFIAAAKTPTSQVCLLKFEFNVEQAYVLEVGDHYIRFYRNRHRIENSPGVAVEVSTPYAAADVFSIQTEQSFDVMWAAHTNYPIHKLLRFGDAAWQFVPVTFDPPPSVEAPVYLDMLITASGLDGTITITGTADGFLDGDVGRQITFPSSQAVATITSIVGNAPNNTVNASVLSTLPGPSFAAGSWRLEGPLGVGLRLSPVNESSVLKGSYFKALLWQRGIMASELVSNGAFASGLTDWSNHSGDSVVSGTHTGGNNSPDLQDTATHFPAQGVTVGYRAVNNTDGSNANITAIRPDGNALAMTLAGGSDNDWDTGDTYNIYGNGGAVVANGGAQLSAGEGGVGWITHDPITTVNGQLYRATFDVQEGSLSCMVGSTAKGSELYAEATFPIGLKHEVIFQAVSTGSYISFRNNQAAMARVTNVSCKNISATGWRNADIGSFIKAHNGIFEVRGLDNLHSANVLCRTVPDPIDGKHVDIHSGAWTLEVPAWSASRGYPKAISFHQDRLVGAGTVQQPLTLWHSETGSYEQFGASSLADSSLEQVFAGSTNIVQWMHPFRDLLVGSAAGEHLLRGANGPLTPGNAEQLPQSRVGSAKLRPLRIDNALILLQRGARQIKELIFDDVGSTIRGKDHTLLANHITESGIVQWAMQTKPQAIIWAVRTDGVLIGETYEQFEEVQGWHRHKSGNGIRSVAVVPVEAPSDQYTEDVYLLVERTINGQTVRYVEVQDQSLALHSAITYSGAPTTTLAGLGHLEGETVQIVDRSRGVPTVLMPRVVSGGSITVERPVTLADVGLGYAMVLALPRPEVPLRNGTLQGQKKRWIKLSARVQDALGLTINGEAGIFRTPDDVMDSGIHPRNGDVEVNDLGWTNDGYITIEHTDPLPATILAVYGDLDVEESG